MPKTVRRPIRIGVHGSPRLAERIVEATGRGRDAVEFLPYDVVEPFRPLRDGTVHMMIVKYELREPDIICSAPVAFDDRAVIVSADHPLAGRDRVSVEELAGFDAFQCPGGFPSYVWDKVVPPETPGGKQIRRVHPMTTVEAMTAILAKTNAVHVSFGSLAEIAPPHIRVVPVHDIPPAPVSFAWLRGATLPRNAATFITDAEGSPR